MTPRGLYTQFHLTEITYAKVCIRFGELIDVVDPKLNVKHCTYFSREKLPGLAETTTEKLSPIINQLKQEILSANFTTHL